TAVGTTADRLLPQPEDALLAGVDAAPRRSIQASRDEETRDRLANHLVGAHAEQPLAGLVDRLDDAVVIEGKDGVGRRLDDGPCPRFAVATLLDAALDLGFQLLRRA